MKWVSYLCIQQLTGFFLTLKSFLCLPQTPAQKLHLRLRTFQLQLQLTFCVRMQGFTHTHTESLYFFCLHVWLHLRWSLSYLSPLRRELLYSWFSVFPPLTASRGPPKTLYSGLHDSETQHRINSHNTTEAVRRLGHYDRICLDKHTNLTFSAWYCIYILCTICKFSICMEYLPAKFAETHSYNQYCIPQCIVLHLTLHL